MSENIVYKIKNIKNGKTYIGSTGRGKKRWHGHKAKLRYNQHGNPILQEEWNEYGENAFTFEVIKQIDQKNNLKDSEQFYIDTLNPEYNICPQADHSQRSKHTRDKISDSLQGLRHSEKTRQKMSESHKGIKHTEGEKRKISLTHRGEKAQSSKLTKKKVKTIKYLLQGDSFTQKQIGKMYGVIQGTISAINNEKTWSHITIK